MFFVYGDDQIQHELEGVLSSRRQRICVTSSFLAEGRVPGGSAQALQVSDDMSNALASFA